MANLTAEYLDKQLGKLDKKLDVGFKVIKNDIRDIKSEIKTVRVELKEDIENLAAMTNRGLEEVSRKLDVWERVEKLERRMDKVSEALNLFK